MRGGERENEMGNEMRQEQQTKSAIKSLRDQRMEMVDRVCKL